MQRSRQDRSRFSASVAPDDEPGCTGRDMKPRGTDRIEDQASEETPEDVAVLYSWANLHGAKYRDFSASRREDRAQLRHRAAEQVRHQALPAPAEAEEAAKPPAHAPHPASH